jgi:N-acetylmuramoyl-L-alanine amidase
MHQFKQSPHYKSGRKKEVSAIVIHYTSSPTLDGTIAWFLNPKSKVSAHYAIGPDGTIVQMVKDEDTAWHAGRSLLYCEKHVNNFSIGIELVNWGLLRKILGISFAWPEEYTRKYDIGLGDPVYSKGEWWAPYPETQIKSCIKLCETLRAKHPAITAKRIVGHMDVSPGRKRDPGPHFPIERIRDESNPILEHHEMDVSENEMLAKQGDRREESIFAKLLALFRGKHG